MLLAHDILDRKLVALSGVGVVRVNNAELQVVDDAWHLTGIEISAKGMLRRLGPRWFAGGIGAEIIDWATIKPLATLWQTAGRLPEKIVLQFLGTRLLETKNLAALRIDPGHDVPDGAGEIDRALPICFSPGRHQPHSTK